MSFYKNLYNKVRPILFKIDAEKSHNIVRHALSFPQKIPLYETFLLKYFCKNYERLHQQLAGLHFYNPIGLAGGFDKNCEMIRGMSLLGFGYLELGTITNELQEGNEKPRLFRHIAERSLQNSMGFNNIGARGALMNLKNDYPFALPIGINIGKNKFVAQADALKNYQLALETLKDSGDYFTFNLSSPNTPKLRDLQNETFIKELLDMAKSITKKPIFIKISPDMQIDHALKLIESAVHSQCTGIIATNTTTDYSLIANPYKRNGENIGGISGEALKAKSREMLKEIGKTFFGKTIIVSVGGISDAKDVYERVRMGANLVQIFSAIVFDGPSIIRDICKDLDTMLQNDGFSNISQAVGADIQ